jgi:hypothetical protein
MYIPANSDRALQLHDIAFEQKYFSGLVAQLLHFSLRKVLAIPQLLYLLVQVAQGVLASTQVQRVVVDFRLGFQVVRRVLFVR